MTKLVKVCVDRSAGGATVANLPYCYTDEAVVTYVAENCPALKKLVLDAEELLEALSLVIGKFKNLESLEITRKLRFKDIITEIGVHCENFVALSLIGSCIYFVGGEEVMAIVTCFPKIKFLDLSGVMINRKNLIKILKGCVELVHLDVRYCTDLDVDDEELSKLASHIPKFECFSSPYRFLYCRPSESSESRVVIPLIEGWFIMKVRH